MWGKGKLPDHLFFSYLEKGGGVAGSQLPLYPCAGCSRVPFYRKEKWGREVSHLLEYKVEDLIQTQIFLVPKPIHALYTRSLFGKETKCSDGEKREANIFTK